MTRLALKNILGYWHLLSLDAPSVAMLWTWFIARCSGIQIPPKAILAMGTVVWLLYAADRLLDTRSPVLRTHVLQGLEHRHHFHRLHRWAFRAGIALASLAIVYLSVDLARPSIRLYLFLGAPLAAYFLLIHKHVEAASQPVTRVPKEMAVGVLFSAATFVPTVARGPSLRVDLLPAGLLFGLLCSLNCLFIYTWEHAQSASTSYPEAHAVTRLALRFLPQLAGFAILGASCLAVYDRLRVHSQPVSWQLAAAIALATALLLELNARHQTLGPTTLRAAADLCLLTPILFLLTASP